MIFAPKILYDVNYVETITKIGDRQDDWEILENGFNNIYKCVFFNSKHFFKLKKSKNC